MVQVLPATEDDVRQWTPPLFFPVVAFLAGIAIDNGRPDWIWAKALVLAAAVTGFILFRSRPRARVACLLLMAAAAGAIHHFRVNSFFPDDHIRNVVVPDPSCVSPPLLLTGRVVSPPMINRPEKTFPYHSRPDLRTRFLLQAESLIRGGRSRPACGLVEVSIPGMIDRYRCGHVLTLRCRLTSTHFAAASFPFPARPNSYANAGVFVRARVAGPKDITIVAIDPWTRQAILQRLRQTARAFLLGNELPPGEHTSGLLTAFVFGDRYRLENELNQAMVNIGAAHLLAVSGFNLAVLAAALWGLCTLTGVPQKATTLIVVLATVVYGLLTDLQPPVVRAMIMILVFSVGALFNKQTCALNSLAVAALIILWLNPNQLFHSGFQLSFMSTLGLIVLSNPLYQAWTSGKTPPLPCETDPRLTRSGWLMYAYALRTTRLMFCASVAAGLASLPLVMIHFNLLSFLGPVSTALLFIPATLLTLAGFAKLVLATLIPASETLLGWITGGLSNVLSSLSLLLARLPGASLSVPPPPWSLTILYFLVLFFPLIRRSPFTSGWRLPAMLLLIAVYLTGWVSRPSVRHPWLYVAGGAEGQTVILHVDRTLVFFDCGTAAAGKLAELTRKVACASLATPAAVLLTCPDQRFFNDLGSLTAGNPSLRVFLTPGFRPALARDYLPVDSLLSDPTLARHRISAGTTIQTAGLRIKVLYPPADLPDASFAQLNPGRSTIAPRESSGVVLIHLGTQRILLATRLGPYACNYLCRNYPALRVDTLILNGANPPNPRLAQLITRLRPQRIIAAGATTVDRAVWYQSLARTLGSQFLKAADRGGCLLAAP